MRPKIILCLLTCLALSSKALAQTWYPITLSKINAKETRVGMISTYGATIHPWNTKINWHSHPTYWPSISYIPAGSVPAGQEPHSLGAWVTGDSNYNYCYYRGADGKLRLYTLSGGVTTINTGLDANGPIFGQGYNWYFYYSHDDGQRNWLRERHTVGGTWTWNTSFQLPRGTLAFPASNAYYLYFASLYDRRIHAIKHNGAWVDDKLTALDNPRAVPNAQVAVEPGAWSTYFIGEDGGVYWLYYQSPNGPWTPYKLGTLWNANTTSPGIAYAYAGSPLAHRLYYKGASGNIWTFVWSGGAWTGPTELPTTLMAPATHLTVNPSTGDVFYVGRDNRVRGITAASGRQIADADSDGLPDSEDSGGSNSDRDGDGILDGVEQNLLGSSPVVASADADDDGIPESFETFYGLSDSNAADAFGDLDGDRYPNVFEIRNGSDPSFAGSVPAAVAIADPRSGAVSSADNIYATVAEALTAARTPPPTAGGYPVVLVREGFYLEQIVIDDHLKVCLMGETTLAHATLSAQGNVDAVRILNGQVCIDGLTIARASGQGRGISVELPAVYSAPTHAGTSRQVRFTNLILCDHRSTTGAAMFIQNAVAAVAHCTLFDNYASTLTSGIQADGSTATVTLVNSILWNRPPPLPFGLPDTGQTDVSDGATITSPQNCIVHAVGVADPLLDIFGGLRQGSPAINAGASAASLPLSDINGEPRTLVSNSSTLPDIGADEYVDIDPDGLADWFEYRTHGTLLTENPSGDTDGDGLSDAYETLLGTDKNNRDTDGDGLWDGIEIEFGLNPLDATDADFDGDGVNIIDEYRFGLNQAANDSGISANRDLFTHDVRSRLTGYSRGGSGGAGSFTLDLESNIKSASER